MKSREVSERNDQISVNRHQELGEAGCAFFFFFFQLMEARHRNVSLGSMESGTANVAFEHVTMARPEHVVKITKIKNPSLPFPQSSHRDFARSLMIGDFSCRLTAAVLH